jgi:hypothetical protein
VAQLLRVVNATNNTVIASCQYFCTDSGVWVDEKSMRKVERSFHTLETGKSIEHDVQ